VLKGGYPEIARIIHSHPTLSEAVDGGRAPRRRLADPRLMVLWPYPSIEIDVRGKSRPAEVRKKPLYSKE
jgi:hypothetical protein